MSRNDTLGTIATTVRVGEDGVHRCTYHETVVVAWTAEWVELSAGADEKGKPYLTATTKRRMNQCSEQYRLGFEVRARRDRWIVYPTGHGEETLRRNGKTITTEIFFNGLRLERVQP